MGSRQPVHFNFLKSSEGGFDFSALEFHGTQLNRYSTRNLFLVGFLNPRGSVLKWTLILRTTLLCAIALFIMFYPCPTIPASQTLKWRFCFPVLNSGEGLIFASLVSFLLGLFQSTTFARWWSTREKLGNVMNHICYTSIALTRCVPGDPGIVNSAANLREKVIRWLNLTHAMIYKHANQEVDLADLTGSNHLTNEEAEILMSAPNLPGATFDWAMGGLRELSIKNAITPPTVYPHMLASMSTIFMSLNEIAAFLETQLPYSYLHLLTLITKIHLAFVVFYSSGIIAGGYATESWARILFGFALIIFNNIIYEGLLAIHDMLVNPLGNDEGDFPSGLYKAKTEAFTKQVQHGARPSVEFV